jgi:hypothetical protein
MDAVVVFIIIDTSTTLAFLEATEPNGNEQDHTPTLLDI